VNGPEVPEGVAGGGVPLGTGACMRPGTAKNSDLVRRRKEGMEPACIRPHPFEEGLRRSPSPHQGQRHNAGTHQRQGGRQGKRRGQ
jgi:hypothetical protein